MSRKTIDLTGQRFGRLVVLEKAGKDEKSRAIWFCQCDCGNTCVVASWALRSGDKQSCGCLQKEKTAEAHNTWFKSHKTL